MIQSKTASQAWLLSLQDILTADYVVPTRQGLTLELLAQTHVIDMRYPFITVTKRNLNFRYIFNEARWVMSGSNSLDFSESIGKTQGPYSQDKMYMQGAYGPKWVDQLPYVLEVLKDDPLSRQAVISIWHARPRVNSDIPCTTQMQFLIRRNQLHCMVTMRSSDAWLGRPNDWGVFALLSTEVLYRLNMPGLILGDLHVTSASSHLYEKDLIDAEHVLKEDTIVSALPFAPHEHSFANFRAWLHAGAIMDRKDSWEHVIGGM